MIEMAIVVVCSLFYIEGGDLDDTNGDYLIVLHVLFTILYCRS